MVDIAEFIWNLKRLIRDGFPQGLPLADLERQYKLHFHWIPMPIPYDIASSCRTWMQVFKKVGRFKEWFRITQRKTILVLPKPEKDLRVYFRLSCYTQYISIREGGKIQEWPMSESEGDDDSEISELLSANFRQSENPGDEPEEKEEEGSKTLGQDRPLLDKRNTGAGVTKRAIETETNSQIAGKSKRRRTARKLSSTESDSDGGGNRNGQHNEPPRNSGCSDDSDEITNHLEMQELMDTIDLDGIWHRDEQKYSRLVHILEKVKRFQRKQQLDLSSEDEEAECLSFSPSESVNDSDSEDPDDSDPNIEMESDESSEFYSLPVPTLSERLKEQEEMRATSVELNLQLQKSSPSTPNWRKQCTDLWEEAKMILYSNSLASGTMDRWLVAGLDVRPLLLQQFLGVGPKLEIYESPHQFMSDMKAALNYYILKLRQNATDEEWPQVPNLTRILDKLPKITEEYDKCQKVQPKN